MAITNAQDIAFPTFQRGSLARLVDDQNWITSGVSQWSSQVNELSLVSISSGQKLATLGSSGRTTGLLSRGHVVVPIDARFSACTRHQDEDILPLEPQMERPACCDVGVYRKPQNARLPIRLPSEPRWVEHHPRKQMVAVVTANMELVLVDTESFQITNILTPTVDGEPYKASSFYPVHQFNEQPHLFERWRYCCLFWWQFKMGFCLGTWFATN